ncbi:MAG: hypothetical protein RLY93_09990 [Sumerlaeia bacterium]
MVPRFRFVVLLTAIAALAANVANAAETYRWPELQWFGLDKDLPTSVALSQRLERGEAIQVLAMPGPRQLLDPDSVRASWAGKPLTCYLYYTTPELGLILVESPVTTGTHTLRVHAGLVDSDRGAMLTSEAELTTRTATRANGTVLKAKLPGGAPAPYPRIFGQQRRDLFGVGDERGQVLLDAPTRTTPNPHHIWAEGAWALPFDPRTSTVLELEPLPSLRHPYLYQTVTIRSNEGEPVPIALIWQNRTLWTVYRGEESDESKQAAPNSVLLPDTQPGSLVVLAPGFKPEEVQVPPSLHEIEVTLQRRESLP